MRTSTELDRIGAVRSAMMVSDNVPDVLPASLAALSIVVFAALQAKLFKSVPRVNTSRRPNIVFDHAVTKASTTPDPMPTSTTNGEGFFKLNLVVRKSVSDALERVSKSRNESSAGS